MITPERLAEIRRTGAPGADIDELVTAYEAAREFAEACAYEDTFDNTRYARKVLCAIFTEREPTNG
jgi:hypothetical protein